MNERVASYTLYEGGTWRYYHNDHLSGTTLTTDEDGEVVQVLDYEPYGEQTLSTNYGTQGSPYSYTGKELDPSSGLYYYEARWYDPETGHFISTDPFPRRNPAYMIPDPARWNEYAYARGNPVAYNDPSGEGFWDVVKEGVEVLVDGALATLDAMPLTGDVSDFYSVVTGKTLFAQEELTEDEIAVTAILGMVPLATGGDARLVEDVAEVIDTIVRKIDDVVSGISQAKRGELKSTIDRIGRGEKFAHDNDGTVFQNREGLLPEQPEGYYTEYVHPTNGQTASERIVTGQGGEVYYTPDHYQSFVQVE